MLLKEADIKSIRENKVTFIKKFSLLKRNYDFNLLSQLMEENPLVIDQKSRIGNLQDVFHVPKVSNCLTEFKTFLDFLSKIFKYENHHNDEIDLFFSFVSQVGESHVDREDVFIMGLKGKVIYKVFGTDVTEYIIEKGDMIFIPRGIKHKVIGTTPRIVAAAGFFGARMKAQM